MVPPQEELGAEGGDEEERRKVEEDDIEQRMFELSRRVDTLSSSSSAGRRRRKKRRMKKLPKVSSSSPPRTRKFGDSFLRTLRSWQSLSCVSVLPAFPWFDCGYLRIRQLEASGRFLVLYARVDLGSWDDSRPCSQMDFRLACYA